MKKFFLLIGLISSHTIIFSQTLFTYGGNSVNKEEFLKAYNKNKTAVEDKEKSLREYLDLYVNFKLKVEAAKNARLDTLPQLQYDVQAFKSQIQEGYLNNEEDVNQLLDEAFNRSQKDIHVQHFLITTDSGALPVKAGEQIVDALQKGNNNFDQLTKEISEKYHCAIKTADLGYITAFSLPYEYENIIYALKPGQVSQPYLSKKNIHIFKVTDERKAMGKWKTAQILLALPPGDQSAYIKPLEAKANAIYQQLKNGADFGLLAKENSDDKLTYLNNGEMPEFGCGKYDLSFENEVIKLKKNGDISVPFTTSYGFHIIKCIEHAPVPANKNENDAYWYELKQKILQDGRINATKNKFINSVVKQIGFKRNIAVKDSELLMNADSILGKKDVEIKKMPISNKVIFSFAKSNIKGSDWLNFISRYKNNIALYKGESNIELLQKFINISTVEYYKKHLDEYNSQFAYQMKEFKEGNMLFEIMDRNVWNKAISDSNGLKKFYTVNKNKYIWGKSANVIIFNCPDSKTANEARDIINSDKDWKKIFQQKNTNIQTDSGRYEINQLPLDNAVSIGDEFISTPIVNPADGTASFVKVLKIYPDNQQRSFEEAKGLLINDFQNQLEENWIAGLKKKYPVKINEAVFKSLIKE